MYRELFVGIFIILLPAFFYQFVKMHRIHGNQSIRYQWMIGLISGMTAILSMMYPIRSGLPDIPDSQWDLVWIPCISSIMYGSRRGGALSLSLVLAFGLIQGNVECFPVMSLQAMVMFAVLPPFQRRFKEWSRLTKHLSAGIIGIVVLWTYSAILSVNLALVIEASISWPDYLLAVWKMGFVYFIAGTFNFLMTENLLNSSKQQEEYQRLIDASLDPIGVISDHRFVFLNPAGYQMFGILRKEDILLTSLSPFIHPAHSNRFENAVAKAQNGSVQDPIELRWVRPVGGIVDTEVSFFPFLYENKPSVQIVIRDTTRRKRTEQLLKESKLKYKSLFEHHPDCMISMDIDGSMLQINDGGEKLTGFSKSDCFGRSILRITYSDDVNKTMHYFQLAVKGQPQTFDSSIVCRDGRRIAVSVIYVPIYIDTRISGVHGIIRDVSKERALWNRLQESEQRYRKLVEESPKTIVLSKNGQIYYINETGVKLLGARSKDEIVGKSLIEFVHVDYIVIVKERLEQVQMGHTAEVLEHKLVRLDGEVIDVEVKKIPSCYQGEESEHIIISDITELKKSREMLQQSKKLTIVGELAAGIAHEIRNPLTSLRGFVQLLEFKTRDNPEYFHIMLEEIDRINTIVGELLLLAKPKVMNLEPRDIRSILESVVTLLGAQANLHNVEIEWEHMPGELKVCCEENKLKQVFVNILKNAIEAMPKGGLVHISLQKLDGKAYIRFVDQGVGIPKALMDKLGQPFYTTKEKGTGLGLMISQSIINNHRGSMTISSMEREGTTVEIMLPVYQNERHLQPV